MSSKQSGSFADMIIERLVVDSSVAVKWFLKDKLEADVDLANEILFQYLSGALELHAPSIFHHEVDGALTRACLTRFERGGPPRMTVENALAALETLGSYPITIHTPTLEERQQILNMAVDYSKGNYDMLYIWLAEQLDCQWCTADDRFLISIREGFPIHRVLLLSSLRAES